MNTKFSGKIPLYLLVSIFLLAIVIVVLINSKRSVQQYEFSEIELENQTTGELLTDFPELPIYQGAEVVSSMKERLGDQVTYKSEFEVEGDTDILGWYSKSLSDLGWEVQEGQESNTLYAYTQGKTYILKVLETENRTTLMVEVTYDED